MSTNEHIYENPRFQKQKVAVAITLHDNDFGNQLRQFICNVSNEMVSTHMNRFSTEEKEQHFRNIWNNIIPTLYYMSTIRASSIDIDYDPSNHQPDEKLLKYLNDRFKIAFDGNAQKLFDEYGSRGNGEFYFVDINGEIGWF